MMLKVARYVKYFFHAHQCRFVATPCGLWEPWNEIKKSRGKYDWYKRSLPLFFMPCKKTFSSTFIEMLFPLPAFSTKQVTFWIMQLFFNADYVVHSQKQLCFIFGGHVVSACLWNVLFLLQDSLNLLYRKVSDCPCAYFCPWLGFRNSRKWSSPFRPVFISGLYVDPIQLKSRSIDIFCLWIPSSWRFWIWITCRYVFCFLYRSCGVSEEIGELASFWV